MIRETHNTIASNFEDLCKMLDALPYAIASVSPDNVILFSNREWKEICGVATDAPLTGTLLPEFLPASLRQPILQALDRCKSGNKSVSDFTEQINHSTKIVYKISAAPVRLNNDDRAYTISVSDATEQCPHIEQKKIDHLKSNFLAMISHELRTPLTSIRGAVHLINSNNQSQETTDVYNSLFGIINTNTERLIGLVNNLLDMVAIDNNTFTIVRQESNLEELIRESGEKFQNSARLKQIDYQVKTVPCRADIDSIRIRQVVDHLLDNAIKFTPIQGQVCLTMEISDDSAIRITVKDSGCGIPQAVKELIFKRFTQEADTMTRECNGAGIGLYLARSIIEKHDGNLYVTDNENGGSSFVLEIPLKQTK